MTKHRLFQRLVSLALAAALAISLAPTAFAVSDRMDNFRKITDYPGFSDIPENAWYEKNVRAVYEMGLMTGKSTEKFDPDGLLTVAEAVTLAVRVGATYYNVPFVSGGKPWYENAVVFAEEYQIISEGQFTAADYSRPATRAEIAMLLFQTIAISDFNRINRITYIPDITTQTPGWNEIYLLYNAGVLTGKGTLVNGELSGDMAGSFFPDDTVTRAETAAIIHRVADPSVRVSFSLSSHRPGKVVTAANDSFRISIPLNQGWEVPVNSGDKDSGAFFCTQEDLRTQMRIITASKEGAELVTSQILADELMPKYIKEWWDGTPASEASEECIIRGLLCYSYNFTYTEDGEDFDGMAFCTENSEYFYVFFLTSPIDDPDDQFSLLAGLLLSFDMAL